MYTIKCAHSRLSAPGHELLAGDAGARAGARGRPHATPQPHRSSAWTWRPTSSPPPPARGPTGLGAPPPTHEPISDFGQGLPPGAMGPQQHTPALAHNALKPQAIARRRAFRKATHRFALRRPRVSAHVCPRDKHYSGTVRLWLVLSGGSARSHLRRRGASLRLAAHHVGGHPAIASPRRPAPVPPPRPESP